MVEVETLPCPGCDESTWFTITDEQAARLKAGEHIQNVLPHFPIEDREMLISGTCPTCWDEMFEDDEDEYPDYEDLLFPESDDPMYDRDWYVD